METLGEHISDDTIVNENNDGNADCEDNALKKYVA